MNKRILVFASLSVAASISLCWLLRSALMEPAPSTLSARANPKVDLARATVDAQSKPAGSDDDADEMVRYRSIRVQLDHELISLGLNGVEDALGFIEQKYPQERRQRAMGFLMEELAKVDFSVVRKIAPIMTSPVEREGALSAIAQYWSTRDSERLVRFSEGLPAQLKVSILNQLVYALSTNGLESKAAAVIDKMPYSSQRTDAIGSVVDALAKSDPQEAISWISKLPSREDVQHAERKLFAALSATGNVDGLSRRLEKTQDRDIRAKISTKLGQLAAEVGGTKSAVDIASQMPDVDGERAIVGAISTLPIQELPQLESRIEQMKDPVSRSRAAGAYIERLFQTDERVAAEWVLKSPPILREYAMAHLVSHWYSTDSIAASEWIGQLPAGTDRDNALVSLARQLRGSDLQSATEIARQVSDPARGSRIESELGAKLK